MTQTHDELYDSLQSFRARNTLIREVRTLLKGTGLDIRELANELVISNPGHPEQGRIYVTYATGEVSHRRTIWDYLGYLHGHGNDGEGAELTVSAEKIIHILTGRNGDSL